MQKMKKELLKVVDVKTLFNAVSLDHGIPVWQNGDIDISPEYLYENGKTA